VVLGNSKPLTLIGLFVGDSNFGAFKRDTAMAGETTNVGIENFQSEQDVGMSVSRKQARSDWSTVIFAN